MGRWPPFLSHWASLAEVVVLPEPWRPAMSTTLGGWEAVRNLAMSLPSNADELVVDDFDDLLRRVEGGEDLLAEGFGADVLD